MSGHQHCINCLQESAGLYNYPCVECGWSPEQHTPSGLYLSPGTILHGQYQIARMLGHGGFGITYLAWDNLLEIKLAIKEYMPRDFATRNTSNSEISTFAGDAKESFAYGLERFLDEARTLAKFQQHSGIVSVLNVFYGNGTGYMVMEYVDGMTLKEYLLDKGKLSWEQTLQLFMPVMDALRAVHKAGMLHRDISPDNIYLCQDYRIKLLDFGSARFALGGHSRSLSVVVKPGYAPEEQYRTKGKQGTWTDVYSVAASMYRCITDLVPPDALDRLDEDELVKPSNLGVNISAQAELELISALAIKAENRTQTIKSFQQGLLIQVDAEAMEARPQFKKDAVTVAPTNQANEETNGPVFYPPAGEFKNENSGRKETKRGSWLYFLCLALIYGYFKFYYQSSSTKEAVNTEQTSVSPEQESSNSIRQKDIATQIKTGDKYYNAKDYIQAAIWYQKAAEQGDADAQNYLGLMYLKGKGVVQNYAEALNWFQKAADQGSSFAETSLGHMYAEGQGVGKNYSQALNWYQKAADQGDASAQYNLGLIYAEGQGVTQDYNLAGNWYQKAADQGNASAQYNLGRMYAEGKGVTQDYILAVDWLQKAAEQGNASAQVILGYMYAEGQGVTQDYIQAVNWYQKAADQDIASAQVSLGWYYMNGFGDLSEETTDYKKAIYWNKKGAENGDPEGFNNLGWLYENGLGIQQNLNKAAEFYQNAITQGIKEGAKEERIKEAKDRLSKVNALIKSNTTQIQKDEIIDAEARNLTPTLLLALKDLYGVTVSGESVRNAKDKLSSVWFDKLLTVGNDQIYVFFTKSQFIDVNTGEIVGCHACSVSVGVITYQLVNNKWQVISKDPNFIPEFGSFGDVPNDKQPELIKLKNNKPVFKIYSKNGGQGVIIENETLFIFSKNNWISPSFTISENNHGNCSNDEDPSGPPSCFGYEGQLKIIDGNKEFPDLLLKRNGSEGFQDKTPVKDITYVFNGKNYVELVEKRSNENESVVDADAQIKLANEFYSKKNYKEAIVWYRKAAEQSNIAGQYNLGIIYEKGLGVKKDLLQAIFWYQKAADQNDEDAYKHLTAAQIKLASQLYQAKNYKEAVSWYRKLADQGNAVGQYNLGILYEKGLGIATDTEQSRLWLQKAADQGDADATKKLNGNTPSQNDLSQQDNQSTKSSYKIGDKFQDGSIVFFIDALGEHGLVARPTDSSKAATWEDAVKLVTTLGAGWRLPTKQELNSLYRQQTVVGGFDSYGYWSSTEGDSRFAWAQGFTSGDQYYGDKVDTRSVRAVRAF